MDIRVIAATNRDLRRLVADGRFLDNLFYRLEVIPIAVPPLRERLEDIPMLVAYFADKHETRSGKSIDALEDGVITVDAGASVQTARVRSLKLRQNVEWMECETIRQALALSTEKQQAARLLVISPRALSHYLAKYPFIEPIMTPGRPHYEAFDSGRNASTPTTLGRMSP